MRSSAIAPWLAGVLVVGSSLALSPSAFAQAKAAKPAAVPAKPKGKTDKAKAEKPAAEADDAARPFEESPSPTTATPLEGQKPADPFEGWGVGGKESAGEFVPGTKRKPAEAVSEEPSSLAFESVQVDLGLPGATWVDMTVAPTGSFVDPINFPVGATKVSPAIAYVVGTSYRVARSDVREWEIAARFALSNANVDGTRESSFGARDRDNFTQIASGNLEMSLRPFFKLSPSLVLPVGLALVFPTAMGDMFTGPDARLELARWNVNRASAAARGWEDRSLWEPHRFSVVPSASVLHQRRAVMGPVSGNLLLEGRTKLEIMSRTGGNDPKDFPTSLGVGEVKDVAVNWLLGGGAAFALFDGLVTPGLKAWFAYSTPTALVGSTSGTGAQLVFEPSVSTSLAITKSGGMRFDARLAGTLPVGGPLGSGIAAYEAGIASLRLSGGLSY